MLVLQNRSIVLHSNYLAKQLQKYLKLRIAKTTFREINLHNFQEEEVTHFFQERLNSIKIELKPLEDLLLF